MMHLPGCQDHGKDCQSWHEKISTLQSIKTWDFTPDKVQQSELLDQMFTNIFGYIKYYS